MGIINAAKIALLNRMTPSARRAGLGDLLNPSLIASGRFTTLGGDANESIPATGVAVGDAVIVTVSVNGGTPRTVTTAVAAANAINVVLSGDPGTDHILNWCAIRSV
jgi:hypothetical protein